MATAGPDPSSVKTQKWLSHCAKCEQFARREFDFRALVFEESSKIRIGGRSANFTGSFHTAWTHGLRSRTAALRESIFRDWRQNTGRANRPDAMAAFLGACLRTPLTWRSLFQWFRQRQPFTDPMDSELRWRCDLGRAYRFGSWRHPCARAALGRSGCHSRFRASGLRTNAVGCAHLVA